MSEERLTERTCQACEGGVAPRSMPRRESRSAVASHTSASEMLWQSCAKSRLTTWLHAVKLRANLSWSSSRAIFEVACEGMNLQSCASTQSFVLAGLFLLFTRRFLAESAGQPPLFVRFSTTAYGMAVNPFQKA